MAKNKFVANIIFRKEAIIFHDKKKTHPLAEKNQIVNFGMDFHLWE